MRIIDENGNTVENPDSELGLLEAERVFIAHHDAVPEQPRIEGANLNDVIKEYLDDDGKVIGRDVGWKIEQEYCPARDAWDEYEDVMRYVLYTADELAEIANQKDAEEIAQKEATKQAAEREKFLTDAPGRIDTIEVVQLDTDEALTVIYESMTTAQLDTDEALTGLYEMMNGATK